MTDARGSAAGWKTAAAVAPAAAAALAVATGWALAHPPHPEASPAVAAPPASRPAEAPFSFDHADVRLHREALTVQSRVVHLSRVLHRVRARTHSVRTAALPSFGGSSGGYSGGSAAAAPSGGGGSVSVAAPPAPAAAPAPAPAPAPHTSTGASGK